MNAFRAKARFQTACHGASGPVCENPPDVPDDPDDDKDLRTSG